MKQGDRVLWGEIEGEVLSQDGHHYRVLFDGAPDAIWLSNTRLKPVRKSVPYGTRAIWYHDKDEYIVSHASFKGGSATEARLISLRSGSAYSEKYLEKDPLNTTASFFLPKEFTQV